MTDEAIRILIVDDSALSRLMIRDVLMTIPSCQVVGAADCGRDALRQIEELTPDLVTLDVEMPDISGIDVLRQLKSLDHPPVALMLSRFTTTGAETTTEALLEGAFDFIPKPAAGNPGKNKEALRHALEDKLNIYSEYRRKNLAAIDAPPVKEQEETSIEGCSVVVVGCSTGGPEALRKVLPKLPPRFPVPIVIVQHMPARFTSSLAKRLDLECPLRVSELEQQMPIEAGHVYVAPGGHQLGFELEEGSVRGKLTDDPPENNCRPAVDYTLRAAADTFPQCVLAVIMTGMGQDGTTGCQYVRNKAGRVIAQHADGCTVYGMPKSVIESNLADRVVRLPNLAKAILKEAVPTTQ